MQIHSIKQLLCTAVWFVISMGNVNAQLDNTFLSDTWVLHEQDSQTLGFRFQHYSYMRNTEYFGPIEKGRTLFGHQLLPALVLQPIPRIYIQTGALIQQDFGATPQINSIKPIITLKLLSASGNSWFNFGAIEGALSHGLIEPLFDINSAILRRIENGAQFKSKGKYHHTDLWIDWERFIEAGSPFKEQFTAGFNQHIKLRDHEKSYYELTPIFQGLIFHRGGQIDSDTSSMVMIANVAAGMQAKVHISASTLLLAEGYYTLYRETAPSGYFAFTSGSGMMANVGILHKSLSSSITYWHAENWIAPRGTAMYQSISQFDPLYTQPNRKLFIPRLCYQTPWMNNKIQCVARLEMFLESGMPVDFAYSLYLSYKLVGKMARIKQ
jgi:hypothetical protein